jgi:methionine-gamma-lyase
MKRLGFSTRAIHGRPGREGPGVPLVQPIVTSTTFSFEDAATFGRVMSEEEYGFLYSRLRNPTVEDLNDVLADLEGAEAAQAYASGMGAISAALMISLEPGDTLLCAKQLYGATYAFAEERLKGLGVEVVHLDVTDHEAWRRPARARYIETMSNPGLPVADIQAIAETKDDGILIVDNTFASPLLCRPLELGADIVCESATKYLNGHHDVTAGVLAGSAEAVARARAWVIDTGAVLDAFPAYLLRRGLKTLSLRMERHCANGLAVARFLEADERVERVYYAGLESYPQYELARRQLAGPGGMLAVELRGGRALGETFMDNLELCSRATSLGGVDTVVSHPASTSHRQFTEQQLGAAGITPGLLRVSVGCEDADDIVADLGNALDRL